MRFGVLEGSTQVFPSVPCPLSCLAPQVAFSSLIISTLCRRSRRAARINLLFLKENTYSFTRRLMLCARTDFDVCFEHRIWLLNCGFNSAFSYGFLLLLVCYGKSTVLS